MHAWRFSWISALALAACVTAIACAGGSGSSGFDLTENAAITLALDEQRCVDFEGLRVCPALTTATVRPAGSPTATPTPARTPTTSPTNAGSGTPPPDASPTATPSPTHSPTPAASAEPGVDLVVNRDGTVDCTVIEHEGMCDLRVAFWVEGLPPSALFRVAIRTLNPDTLKPEGLWTIGNAPVPSGGPEMPTFDASVAAIPNADVTGGTATVQLAVLVFLDPPMTIPGETEALVDTGADYAFITTEIGIEAGSYQP
jgi:hypothetical protein